MDFSRAFSDQAPDGVAVPLLDPNELAAKGATLLHHLALWMWEEKRVKEEQQQQIRASSTMPRLSTTAATAAKAREA